MVAEAQTPAAPRKRLPPEQRKAQLLETALEVFARRGFGRAGHAEIAEAAGVAVSPAGAVAPGREVPRCGASPPLQPEATTIAKTAANAHPLSLFMVPPMRRPI